MKAKLQYARPWQDAADFKLSICFRAPTARVTVSEFEQTSGFIKWYLLALDPRFQIFELRM